MAAYSASDTCVCCGEYVPEGRQVCPACEAGKNKMKGEAADGERNHQVGRPKESGGFRRPFFRSKYAKQRTP